MRKNFIRITAAVMTAAIMLTLSACQDGSVNSEVSDSGVSDNVKNTHQSDEMRDISSKELVKELKVGWSLGNTLDGGNSGNKGKSPDIIETAWGNPVTTKEMIDNVKSAGFNIIRVPVTWAWSTGDAPDYIISEEWMDRVQTVVNYAIDSDLYVILNIHHDEWDQPFTDKFEETNDRLIKVWTQIADRFKGYDEHLIFEGQNEPRLKGTTDEWNGGNAEAQEIVNKLNTSFVSTIRNSGGNNPKRHLMIPSYAASSEEKAMKAFKMPENDDKIIVSVHAYTPYQFALGDNVKSNRWIATSKGSVRDIDNLATLLNDIFISKDIPVIIGEFGARSKDNVVARADFAGYYVSKMKEIGVPCIWWDNGGFTGSSECFGLFDRKNLEWRFPEIVNSMMKGVYAESELPTPLETSAPIVTDQTSA